MRMLKRREDRKTCEQTGQYMRLQRPFRPQNSPLTPSPNLEELYEGVERSIYISRAGKGVHEEEEEIGQRRQRKRMTQQVDFNAFADIHVRS
jgi:hypothetical protein